MIDVLHTFNVKIVDIRVPYTRNYEQQIGASPKANHNQVFLTSSFKVRRKRRIACNLHENTPDQPIQPTHPVTRPILKHQDDITTTTTTTDIVCNFVYK
jgi:hypothetical protein